MTDVDTACRVCGHERWNTTEPLTCKHCGWTPRYQRRQILRSNIDTNEDVDRKGVFELPENCRDLVDMFLDTDIRWARQQAHQEIEASNLNPTAQTMAKAVVGVQALQQQAQRNHQNRELDVNVKTGKNKVQR